MNKDKKIYHIYDKCIKKILTLSNRAVINFINGSFGTEYPLDSKITYNWTENHDDELKRTIADGILTINDTVSYHIEAQMGEDDEMQFRVFEYGYRHALNRRNGTDVLLFPEPIIIYLYKHGRTPDEQKILLDFGTQGTFEYKAKTYKLLEHSLEDLNQKKMTILIPFMILKFREQIEKTRTKENMNQLKNFILNDIIGAIDQNVAAGNLTLADANRLRNLVAELYRHVYSHFQEFSEEGINDMVDEGLVLEMDIIEYNHKKEIEEKVKQVTEQVTEQVREQVAEQTTIQLVRNAYKSIRDIPKVADLLGIPEEKVRKIIEE